MSVSGSVPVLTVYTTVYYIIVNIALFYFTDSLLFGIVATTVLVGIFPAGVSDFQIIPRLFLLLSNILVKVLPCDQSRLPSTSCVCTIHDNESIKIR